jgi:hypothetical protein
MAANPLRSRKWPQMAANLQDENVAEHANVPSSSFGLVIDHEFHQFTRMKKPSPQEKFVSIRAHSWS